MSKIFDTSIELKQNELINARIENRTTSPTSPVTGQIWYRSDDVSNVVTGRLIIQTTSGDKVLAIIDDITSSLNDYIPLSQKGVMSGVATLDSSGVIPNSQLPSYVDDILEFNTFANFPTTGETGKMYVAKDTNMVYRWTGTAYIGIAQGVVLGTGTPSAVNTTASAGTSGAAAPFDHVHNIGSRVITSTNIQQNAITNYELGTNAVENVNIKNTTITGTKLVNNTVTNTQLATMSGRTVKMNNSTATIAPQDVSIATLGDSLVALNSSIATVSVYSNSALTPSGGVCTWTISNALTTTRQRLGFHVPTIEIFDVSTPTAIVPVEMDININNSTRAVTIYFNSAATVPANKYIAKITE